MRHQISWSDEAVLHILFSVLLPLLLFTGVVRSGQPISGLPDDGGFDMPERSDGAKVGHLRHAFSILEPELAQSVWSREGLKNPIRRTTTIPMNDRLDIGNTGELQPKGANKPMKRRPRKAEGTVSEYDTLNDDFLTEYDLLNLDFSLDEPQDGKKNAKEVEVPAKEFEWEEGEKRKGEENFPPKEWWDLEEPTEGSSTTATTKKQTLKGTKLFVVKEDGSSRNAEEQEHSLERESGRVRRDAAKTQSAGQTLRGIAEWSGEAAIERDEVKLWPKLVPVRSKSELPPILWPTVPTTKRPQTVPKEEGKKRISGGNDDALETNGESRKEKKKEEMFRDLPSGVEVVSSLVEKAVENGQKSRNKTQRQKIVETLGKATSGRGRVEPKKQNRPAQQMPRILDRDSPEPTNSGRTAPMKKNGKMASKNNSEPQQKQIEKSSQKMQEEDRLLDSLPTIIIGDPPAENQSEQKFKSEALNVSFSNGNEKAEQNITKQQQNGRPKGQIEVAPADQSPQLPPGFVYLATVDTLPKDGRLLIGNRSYVIEKMLQRHLFPEQQRKVVANDGEFGGTNERHGKMEGEEHSQSERMNIGHTDEEKGREREGEGGRAERGQQMMEGRTVIGSESARGKSARRLTPRHKAFVVATSQQVPPPPPGTVNDHFIIVQNSQNGKAQQSDRKTDILARHLGMTLSQIFGNFTLGHFPANSGKKATTGNEKQPSQEVKTDSKMDSENGGRTDGERTDGERTDGGRMDQVVSEPHRLTRVFEKKRP